ncbi:MAG: class I SAM-dependent methyltransferase [Ignavibacteriae bacterium]|nr:class I SAM-dependent methyltransferase [Ignavibacteriota bacterium]
MVKVLHPRTRAEEYEYRAKHLKDEFHMSGDGPKSTAFRIDKVLRHVPFASGDRVLDIGPGKGLLFERIHARVTECCGIDVTPAMVERLKEKFDGYRNVSLTVGWSKNLPYPSAYFDKVLMTGAFCLQETKEECMQTLAEIRRVAKPDALIFISDIAIVDESTLSPERLSPISRVTRRFRQDGPVDFIRSITGFVVRKTRVILEVEPVIVESTRGSWFPHEEFIAMCRSAGLDARGFQTEMIIGLSPSRNDYLIRPLS